MRLDTASGLHGQLIAFQQTTLGTGDTDGVAIVRRDHAYQGCGERVFSVHTIYGDDGGTHALNGAYDLTLSEAFAEFQRRWESSAPGVAKMAHTA